MSCCHNCFEHPALKSIVQAAAEGDKGTCSYCGTVDTDLTLPSALEDVFQPILDLYVKEDKIDVDYRQEQSLSFVAHLQARWNVFHAKADHQNLIKAIFQSQLPDIESLLTEQVYTLCLNSKDVHDFTTSWQTFVDEVKQHNRFLPRTELDSLKLSETLGRYMKTIRAGEKIYRARITDNDIPLTEEEMGKPPRNKATGGRANPVGIPYLYVSYDAETPVYESRAGLIDFVSVAEFELTRDISVVPLCDFSMLNPFEVEDPSDLVTSLVSERYLSVLERELSRPIRKQDQELDYVPTQYLCEYIKRTVGADGVEYGSSIKSGGKNLVLFTDDNIQYIGTTVNKVTSISLQIERVIPAV